MFQSVEIASPTLSKVASRYLSVAQFHSIFFKPISPPPFYPDFSRGDVAVLMDVLGSDFLRAAMPELFPLDLDRARKFCLLERFEFEGSLIHMLLRGTCTEKVVGTESEAREIAGSLLSETILRPDGLLRAFRMEDVSWSEWTRKATTSSTYFVYAPFDKTWWFVGFADDY
jgi:hypothetical protein